jgi:hypothetical protein
MRISVPACVASNFEAVVAPVDGRWWKLVRTFDDPDTWTEPGERHLAASGAAGEQYRTEPLADEWELYDLSDDPTESSNRWRDAPAELREHLLATLSAERDRCVPPRRSPWPYVARRQPSHT